MFTRRTHSVWIGILALSCMFLLGQESWLPDPCTGVDCGEHGTCVEGICECDFGYEGEFCDALIEVEPCEPPCVPYNPIPAGQLAPTGCETYIGAHPVYPGEILCCSAPSEGSAPQCAPGDTPDIPCVVEMEFCDDGTVNKAYSPDPLNGYPGQTVSTSGSWTVVPHTGELEIITTASAMGGGMIMETT